MFGSAGVAFNLQRFSMLLRWSLAIYRHHQRAEGWHQMDTLLIIGGVLLIAVVGRSLLDPWPCATSEHRKSRLAASNKIN